MQKIDARNPAPKYLQIKENIRRAVERGQWRAGEQLPRFRELCAHFSTTPPTMSRALELLERSGLIERQHGKGIFVTERSTAVSAALSTALVVMRVQGHLYGDLFSALSDALEQDELRAVPLDYSRWPYERRRTIERDIESMLSMDVAGMIVDATGGLVIESFEKLRPFIGQMVFIHRYDFKRRIPDVNYALVDYAHGGRVMAETLVRRGAQRILILHPLRRPGYDREAWLRSTSGRAVTGVAEAMSEAGIDVDEHLTIFDMPIDRTPESLAPMLREGADAAICFGDALAPRLYHAAGEAGRRVGEDLPVIGMYNTPWCGQLVPQLSSLSIEEGQLARVTAQLMRDGVHGETLWVKPTLIERSSTLGPSACDQAPRAQDEDDRELHFDFHL